MPLGHLHVGMTSIQNGGYFWLKTNYRVYLCCLEFLSELYGALLLFLLLLILQCCGGGGGGGGESGAVCGSGDGGGGGGGRGGPIGGSGAYDISHLWIIK